MDSLAINLRPRDAPASNDGGGAPRTGAKLRMGLTPAFYAKVTKQ
jgi:hypothetical protein